jgi:hypothetical protein
LPGSGGGRRIGSPRVAFEQPAFEYFFDQVIVGYALTDIRREIAAAADGQHATPVSRTAGREFRSTNPSTPSVSWLR